MKINHFDDNIDIQKLNDHDPLWEQIDSNDMFSLYHSRIWKDIIEDTFNHTAVFLAATDKEQIVDILPLFLIRSRFLGKKLVSTPYEGCNGGFASTSVEARKLLIERTLQHAQQWKVKYVEIRSRFPVDEFKEYGFIENKPFIISEIPLKGQDENFKMLSPKHRRNVKIAQKKGVSVVPATRWDQMEAFYKILTDHYKNLGNPFFGKKFFNQIWEKLIKNNYASLLLAIFDRQIIGGHLLFFSGKTLISKYSAVKKDNEFLKLYASYALFWESIRLGIINNFTNFNLGITGESNTGLLDFKSRFGSKISPIYFYYYPIRGKLPAFDKYYSGFSLLKKIWRAAPTILTSPIGQKISEWIC